ncbi:MAG: CoA transferase [Chloroflexota bacterium]
MPGPLNGIKIVDLTTVVMGPFATQLLGDMGADIIKVEPLSGDVMRFANHGRHRGMSNVFLNLNRNKRSLALDMKADGGQTIITRLIKEADVIVSNIRPKSMARLQLAYEDTRQINPKLIYVNCFGFGQSGPYADRAAYDDLIQGMAGVPSLFEKAYQEAPKYLPSNFCDRVTGLNVVNAVTTALFYRERHGVGQAIEIPMFETMVQFILGDHLGGYTFDPPEGEIGYARIVNPNRRPFATKDGFLAILVYNDKQWAQFLTLIGRSELVGTGIFADQATRGLNIKEVYGFVGEVLTERSTAEWLALFKTADFPHAPIEPLEKLLEHEHLTAVNFFEHFDHPSEGPLVTTAIPSQWSHSKPEITRHAPRLGEHSAEILRELNFSEAEIEHFLNSGVTHSA